MTAQLSIVILNWNVADLLAGCLRALPAAAGEWWPRCEVLVVDNASTDESVAMVRRDFPHVRLLALPTNRGFTGGNNAGILASRGKYILLLNPDTVPLPGSISSLASYMVEQPEVGIVGPRLLNPDGTLQPSRRRFPTLVTALVESTPLQRWLGSLPEVSRFYMEDQLEGETQQVDWLSGAALMCRRDALMQVGLLDPGYFMFSEEVDLCRRLKGVGWEVVYLPSAEIMHLGGGSTGQDVPSRHINFNTSKARYFRLHEGKLLGMVVRRYLLATYLVQSSSELAKWLLRHKTKLRAERLRLYAQVLKSGLREHQKPAKSTDVLLVTGEFPPAQGGVGDYTCKLVGALEAQGIAARVLTRPVTPQTTDERASTAQLPGPGPLLASRMTLRAVLRAAHATHARIAHIQYQTGAYEMRPTVNLLPWLLRLAWGQPTVVTFHDLRFPYLFPKAGPLRDLVNYVMARTASAVIATDPQDYERLRRWGVKRLELVPIGSNIPNNPPQGYNRPEWRQRWGAGDGTTLLAYFGFLNSSKGLNDLLAALQLLRVQGDFRLLMVGGGLGSSDPTNRRTAAQLSDLAERLGVADSLIWTGYLSPQDISAALLSADVAVLPYADGASFRRGSLLAVLEHGLPVVTTRPQRADHTIASMPRLADGENALLVQPGSATELAAAVRRLSSDASLRDRLAAGATQLSSYFSWTAIAERHVELYRQLLTGHEEGGGRLVAPTVPYKI